jgi:hypothetical protein
LVITQKYRKVRELPSALSHTHTHTEKAVLTALKQGSVVLTRFAFRVTRGLLLFSPFRTKQTVG